MAVELHISAAGNEGCTQVVVTDNSVYGEAPDRRVDYGLALFVEVEGVYEPSLTDLTDSDPWTVAVTDHVNYTMCVFQVPIWYDKRQGGWPIHSIVFWDGSFWYNPITIGNIDEPGGQQIATWVELTSSPADYLLFQTYVTETVCYDIRLDCYPPYEFLLGAKVCGDCKVYVTDNTTYPAAIPPSAVLEPSTFYHIALFYSNDLFVADFNQNLIAPATGAWTIAPTTGGTWLFQSFWTEAWDFLATYAQGDVVYYGGLFYYCNDAGGSTGGAAPQFNSLWTNMTVLTPTANYAIFLAASIVGNRIATDTVSVVRSCADITFTQTSCYNWQLCNTTEGHIVVHITDVEGTEINTTTTPSVSSTGTTSTINGLVYFNVPAGSCVTLTFSETGVYEISIGLTELPTKYVIYETCTYWDCYLKMIDAILCSEPDPCCDTCDEIAKKAVEIKRLEINKMMALMNMLNFLISYDALSYMQISTISGARTALLTRIQAIMDKLDDIIVRCGVCGGATSTDIVSPCRGCS